MAKIYFTKNGYGLASFECAFGDFFV